MDDLQLHKAREALSTTWLQNITAKYSDPRYLAVARRKSALRCFEATGLPYRVAFDISALAPVPDGWYPVKPDEESREIMAAMMRTCRRDYRGILPEDRTQWDKLRGQLYDRQKSIRGWRTFYSPDWFRHFGHFLTGYNIGSFTEFDIFGTSGVHTADEVQSIIEKLSGSGTNED